MKRSAIVLFIAVAILMIPVSAYANSIQPNAYEIHIAIDEYSKIMSPQIILSEDGVTFIENQDLLFLNETRRADEKVASFMNTNGRYRNFKLQVVLTSGEIQVSNAVNFTDWGNYRYDVKNNTLVPSKITNWKLTHGQIVMYPFVLLVPLAVTLFVEWLISVAFGLKPGKYVLIINLITNPVMNALILVLYTYTSLRYYAILIALEFFAILFEFWFYTRKYKVYAKKRLILFSAVANVASWGLYYFISNGWFL